MIVTSPKPSDAALASRMLVSARGAASIAISPPESGVRVVIFNCFFAVLVFEGGQATHGDFLGLMRFVARVFTRLSDILSNPWLQEQAETNLVVDPMTT